MIRFDLPAPPSVNAMYRSIKTGRRARTILSKVGRKYLESCLTLARAQLKSQGAKTIRGEDVEMHVYWFRKIRRGDCSNRQKALEDALNTVAYADDAQVARCHIYRVDGETKGRVLVIVKPCPALSESEARQRFTEAA